MRAAQNLGRFIMGGRPSKGTKADKRLGANKGGKGK